ncbi:hypothetical protein E3P86_03477 [Wallemia ichthyophaga]|uniref:Peroxisomal targeting signal receptor n=1 Tax=Wallemia ichthyophaga TaxID=245174 RepID=A0A4T0ITF6_WALIC|nr:hypothetical protein E3P86_03477 [Wallemia ichthyophaga]
MECSSVDNNLNKFLSNDNQVVNDQFTRRRTAHNHFKSTHYQNLKEINQLEHNDRFKFDKVGHQLDNISNEWITQFNHSNHSPIERVNSQFNNNWSNEFIRSNEFKMSSSSPSTSSFKQNYVNFNHPYQYDRNLNILNDYSQLNEKSNWDKQFDQFNNHQPVDIQPSSPNDDLAKTAADLIDTVQPHKLEKFKNSNFFSLMNGLATGKTQLDQDQFVDNNISDWSTSFIDSQQTNQHAHHNQQIQQTQTSQNQQFNPSILNAPPPYHKLFGMFDSPSPTSATNKESLQDGSLEQGSGSATGVRGPQEIEWDNFTTTLDSLDSTNSQYLTSNHVSSAHSDLNHSLQNPKQWYQLGMSQQENENEHEAIPALLKAVELDDKFENAWLALSISYTNESNKVEAINAIKKWLIAKKINLNSIDYSDKDHFHLIQILCQMIRDNINQDQIQPDLQVALGVLFSLNEEYDKSDWLLLNRLGATLSNSGKCQSSLEYYYRALELHPTYVRAKFNLGIALMNIRDFEEAIQQILSAVDIQSQGNQADKSSQFNNNMWDTLKNCLLQ